MPTRAETKYAQAIEKLNAYLHSTTKSMLVAFGEWERTYKGLQAVAKFWGVPDDASWDKVIKETKEEWIGEARKDKAFKGYYILRKEIDRLEVMVQ